MENYKLTPHNFYLELENITQGEFENLLNVLEKSGKNTSVARTWNKDSWKYLHIGTFNTNEVVLSNIMSGIKIKATYQQVLDIHTPKLKIGDKFEHKGFICQVVKDINLGKWYKVESTRKTYFIKLPLNRVRCYNNVRVTEVTDQTFIKYLEENTLA